MDNDKRKKTLAQEYTVRYQDENDIPTKYKRNGKKKSDKKLKESETLKKFRQHINNWISTFDYILENVPNQNQAWRFISINPIIEPGTNRITQNDDFLAFNDLIIKRRDVEKCEGLILGKLCKLHYELQREIENNLNSKI